MIALTLLILPFVGALLVTLGGNRAANKIALLSAVATLIFTAKVYFDFSSGATEGLIYSVRWLEDPNIFFNLKIDGLSLLLLILNNLLTPVIVLSGMGATPKNSRALYALILFMQGAMGGVFMASEGFVFYVFWELSLIPIYFIALLWGTDYTRKITLKFFIYTLAGSLFMLISFILLYLTAGDLRLENLYGISLSGFAETLIFLGFFLAFAIKIPIVPLHTWQADTYEAAPSQGTMLLSGLMLKMGLYGMIRWMLPIMPFAVAKYTPLVITLGVIGVIYGAWIAIQQNNLKRLFAFSSLSHVGLIVAGIFSLKSIGLSGAAVHIFAHGVNVVGIFFAAEIILRRTGSLDLNSLGGIKDKAPWFSAYFFVMVIAGFALPFTNAFVGEFMLIFALWQYNIILGSIAGLTIILASVYLLRMFQRAMLGNTNTVTKEFKDLTLSEHLTFLPLVLLVFVLGVYPMPVIELVQPALNHILELALI